MRCAWDDKVYEESKSADICDGFLVNIPYGTGISPTNPLIEVNMTVIAYLSRNWNGRSIT
jgi:hypothetical protein